ncbi:HAD-IA family hydrolase [Butyrivibrio sp. MB2005]|uniref:HAD-IA family hydrolase n=1 Tax=Butyrivibrio sp. MB2005 TaxID=1280678 RepID=UPI0003FE1FCB|nr:HAD-IA family hydrolase [Butyrivibrio sp. MB2005]
MAKNYSVLLFDLDGTLTDSGPGIINSFEYAIRKMGNDVPDKSQLRRFVGPPLEESFGKILGYSPEDTQKAIVYYREAYFEQGGVLENEVYPGIIELLDALKDHGKRLVIATSKSVKGTDIVLDHFDLRKYFEFVARPNGEDVITKTDVIDHALEQCGVTDKANALMIGDRHYDISAAKTVGIDSVGVLWGYGSREELETAGATYIVEKAEEVLSIVEL